MNVRCDQPKSPEQEGKKERVEEVAREGKERERRVSARAAAGGRTRLIGRRAFFCFKKRWLASREHNSVTNGILCNGALRGNKYPGLGPIRKGVIALGVEKSPAEELLWTSILQARSVSTNPS